MVRNLAGVISDQWIKINSNSYNTETLYLCMTKLQKDTLISPNYKIVWLNINVKVLCIFSEAYFEFTFINE